MYVQSLLFLQTLGMVPPSTLHFLYNFPAKSAFSLYTTRSILHLQITKF